MEDNSPNLRAEIIHLKRVQHLAATPWKIYITRHMRKDSPKSISSLWNAGFSEVTSSCPSRFSKMKLTQAHPKLGWEGAPSENCKGQAVFEEKLVIFSVRVCEMLEQSADTGSQSFTKSLSNFFSPSTHCSWAFIFIHQLTTLCIYGFAAPPPRGQSYLFINTS